MRNRLVLAVALDGHGWHPAAVRTSPLSAETVFTPGYWTALAAEADAARLDLLTLEDTFGPPAVGGRLDAVLIASLIAPVTRHVGLMPVATTTHPEPFHLSTALATLDHISHGRAGWQARVSAAPQEAALVGRREIDPDEVLDEAGDVVEVVRRLWDSWQDDAVIRDVATGRFVDRDRLHRIDFTGRWFGVRGPSIVPRPPQGQPVVAALAHGPAAYEFAAGSADVVFVTPDDADDVAAIVAKVRAAGGEHLRIFGDLVVFVDEHGSTAVERRARLDDLAGEPLRSDAAIYAGSPDGLADLLLDWRAAGLDGFRLRPGALPYDLESITRLLAPTLADRGVWEPHPGTLRERLGLGRAANRYEGATVA